GRPASSSARGSTGLELSETIRESARTRPSKDICRNPGSRHRARRSNRPAVRAVAVAARDADDLPVAARPAGAVVLTVVLGAHRLRRARDVVTDGVRPDDLMAGRGLGGLVGRHGAAGDCEERDVEQGPKDRLHGWCLSPRRLLLATNVPGISA